MSLRIEKGSIDSKTDIQEENKDDAVEAKKQTTPFKEKLKTWMKLITVEPALFAYVFAGAIGGAAVDNLKFETACRVNLELNDTLCSNFTLGINQTIIIKTLIDVKTWNNIVVALLSGILALCFSTFSDRYKIRKPFFVLPMFGEVLSCVFIFLCAIFINDWPVETVYIFATILPALFGGSQTLIVAIYSYIADISTIEERTSRIGLVEFISLILTPLGPAFGAILFQYGGYYSVFTVCGLLYLFSTLYSWYYIPEKGENVKRTKNLCVDIFNIKAVIIDLVKVLVRKRIGYKRCLLLLTYICYMMIKGAGNEGLVLKEYLGKHLKMDPVDFHYYQSFDIIIHIVGMFVAVTLFIKKLKVPDMMIVIMACCFKMAASIWLAFVKSVPMFYVGGLISIFSGIYIIALRSFVTKLVSQSECAKAQALFGITEMIIPLIYTNIYRKFFDATANQFMGAFFLLSAGLIIPPLVIALTMHAIYKKDSKEETATTNEATNGTQKEGVYNEGHDIDMTRL